VLAGIAGVLTTTFVAGVWTGRHWPLLTGQAKPSAAEPGPGRRGSADRPKQAEPLPALTFYHELTAPLTAPPPPPRQRGAAARAQAERGRGDTARRQGAPAEAPGPAAATSPETSASGFTVQVGAYQVRAPADTLREALVSTGHDARVVEARTPGGVRYRVQVGVFPTREAARETAVKLGQERSLPAFVTTR
jgi:cell division protein FtsN